MAKLHRMTTKQIVYRPTLQPVHNLLEDIAIPPAVKILLGKGYKFIPDLNGVSFADLKREGNNLKRQINCREFFQSTEYVPRRLKKARPKGWHGPDTEEGKLAQQIYKRCLENWTFQDKGRGWSFWDHWGCKWLKARQHMMIVADSDKNLGVALCPRKWIDDRTTHHLQEACKEIHKFNMTMRIGSSTVDADKNLKTLKRADIVTAAEVRYAKSFWLCGGDSGTFRLRPKLHKQPISSRPIFTSGRSWQRGLAELLVQLLKPVLGNFTTILRDTNQLQRVLVQLQKNRLKNGQRIDNLTWVTMDVENLYPSVEVSHLIATNRIKIVAHYGEHVGASITTLMALVLRNNFVKVGDKYYHVTQGVPTGGAESCIVTNLYLTSMDVLVVPNAILYKRFIDDVI
eukprot:6486072-Amphidinium_carterae.2